MSERDGISIDFRQKSLAASRTLMFGNGLWRLSEADGHPVIGVHQADREREIHEFAFLEHRPRGLVCFIWHTGLGKAVEVF